MVMLYFVSPQEQLWCQRVFRMKTFVIARNLCVISRVQKGTPGLMRKGCVLQRVSLGAPSDVTVVLETRQSIDCAQFIYLCAVISKCNSVSECSYQVYECYTRSLEWHWIELRDASFQVKMYSSSFMTPHCKVEG